MRDPQTVEPHGISVQLSYILSYVMKVPEKEKEWTIHFIEHRCQYEKLYLHAQLSHYVIFVRHQSFDSSNKTESVLPSEQVLPFSLQ